MVVSVLTFTLPPPVAACQSIGLVGLGFLVATLLVIEAVERPPLTDVPDLGRRTSWPTPADSIGAAPLT